MVIIGTGGHAKELLDVLRQDYATVQRLFFNDVAADRATEFYGYPVLKTIAAVQEIFEMDAAFTLGIGGVQARYRLYQKLMVIGGNLVAVISSRACMGTDAVVGPGSTVMPFASITSNAIAGKALLLNAYASIHHDCTVGDFVEIAPGTRILGGCTIGSYTFIGANATVLPGITVGTNAIVASGAVVTKNVADNTMVAGNPAVIKKQLPPFNL